MKINSIVYKIILVIMLIFISTSSVCFASSYLPNLNDDGYKPVAEDSGNATTIISKIMGALTIVGIILLIIAIAIIGYNTIIGSASDKAFEKEKMIGLAIGAAILIGCSSLAQMLISAAETL